MRSSLVISTLLVSLGCVNPELRENADRIEILEGEIPPGYTAMGTVQAAVRFPNLRPEHAVVIDKLKLRAARVGAPSGRAQ